MHDSLAKTVSGMGFAALALSRRIERDPAGAAEEARRLAEDARQATREAREIIIGLRADARRASCRCRPRCRPRRGAGAAAPASRSRWRSRRSASCTPVAARELEWILREALGNVERHARASKVTVRLRRLGEPRGADRRRRRRRLRGARRARAARAGPPLRRHRHARARAAGRRRPERRVGAGRGLRALGVGAGRRAGAPSRRPRPPSRCAVRYAPAAPLRAGLHVA